MADPQLLDEAKKGKAEGRIEVEESGPEEGEAGSQFGLILSSLLTRFASYIEDITLPPCAG